MKPHLHDVPRISEPQELILIRHATTDMTGTLCGHSNPPLNETGIAQARALSEQLRSWKIRRLYSSDLQRTVQTAQPMAELWQIPIVERSAFREVSFGDWEGRRWSEVRDAIPDIAAMESAPGPCAPGGEAFAYFRDRVLSALKETADECSGNLAAVVTHLGVMRVILNELGAADSVWNPRQRIEPCSFYRIRLNQAFLKTQQS
jgi:alpha-ribazole phosphatase/probable phosphoglycerate mutase